MDTDYSRPPLPSWKVLLGVVVAFFGLTFAIYGHSLGSEFVRWDDGMLVYENPAIREISPASLKHIFTTYDPELYIPLTFLTYQIDYQIAGQQPFLYHLDNLLLHTLNALLTAWFLYLLSKKKWIALACGLLFAVHPLHTEAVEWVSARKDVLSTFFFLLTLISCLYWRENRERRTFVASLVFYILGLLSKVMVITLPVVLLLIDLRDGKKWSPRLLTEKAPYLGLAAVFGIIGVFGKTGVIGSSTFGAKVLMACKSAVFYIQQIVFPLHFSLLYPYTKAITFASPDFFVPVLALLALAGLAWASLRWSRDILFGLLFYLVTVAPTFLNFAKGGELDVYFASDRYAYIPSIGIFFAIACALHFVVRLLISRSPFEETNNEQTKNETRIFWAIVGGLIMVCSFLSYRQSFVWRDTQSLFENVIRYYPESSYVAHNNLGNVYRLDGDAARAIDEYRQAIKIRPNAKTLSNLGAVYRRGKQYDLALQQYEQALKLDPQSKEAHFGLGIVLAAQGKLSDAEAEYGKAIAIDPAYEEAYTNRGSLFVAEGRLSEAIANERKAIAINGYFPDAHYNLAVALAQADQKNDAIGEYRIVLRMVPGYTPARINLAILLFEAGETAEAQAQFEAVLRYDPGNRAATSALRQIGQPAGGGQ